MLSIDQLFSSDFLKDFSFEKISSLKLPSEIKLSLLAFAAIDLSKIPPNQYQEFMLAWSCAASYFVNTYKKTSDIEILITMIYLVHSALQLCTMRPDGDFEKKPLFALFENRVSMHAKLSSKFTLKILDFSMIKLAFFANNVLKCHEFELSDVIRWSIYTFSEEFSIPSEFLRIFDISLTPSDIDCREFREEISRCDPSLLNMPTFGKKAPNFLISQFICNAISGRQDHGRNSFTSDRFYRRICEPKVSSDIAAICACYCTGEPINNPLFIEKASIQSITICALKNGISLNMHNLPSKNQQRIAALIAISPFSIKASDAIDFMIVEKKEENASVLQHIESVPRRVPENEDDLVKFARHYDVMSIMAIVKRPDLIEKIPSKSNLKNILLAYNNPPEPDDSISQVNAFALLRNREKGSFLIIEKALENVLENSQQSYFAFIEKARGPRKSDEEIKMDILSSLKYKKTTSMICASLCASKAVTKDDQTALCMVALYSKTKISVSFDGLVDPEILKSVWLSSLESALSDIKEFGAYVKHFIKHNEMKPTETIGTAVKMLLDAGRYNDFVTLYSIILSDALIGITKENVGKCLDFMIASDVNDAKNFISNLSSVNIPNDVVYSALARNCQDHGQNVLELFQSIPKNQNCASIILNALKLQGEVEFASLKFVKSVLELLEAKDIKPETEFFNEIPVEWGDEKKVVPKSIWDYPTEEEIKELQCTFCHTGKNMMTQPYFRCYTCNLTESYGCCVPCAIACHRGHDLTYRKPGSFYCDCYEKDFCCLNHSHDNKDKDKDAHSPQSSIQALASENERGFGSRIRERNGGFIGTRIGAHRRDPTNDDHPPPIGLIEREREIMRGRHGILAGPPIGGSRFGRPTGGFFERHENERRNEYGYSGRAGKIGKAPVIEKIKPRPFGTSEKQNIPSNDSLFNIIKMMKDITMKPDDPIVNRLTVDIMDLSISGLKQVDEKQRFSIAAPVRPFMFAPRLGLSTQKSSFSSYGLSSKLTSSVMPHLPLIAPCAESGGVLVVDDNRVVLVIDNKEVTSYKFGSVVIGITANVLDPAIFAVVLVNSIHILRLSENKITNENTIELMEHDPGNAFIIAVEWVPLMPFVLAVTTSRYVKVYNIPDDCISPMICFETKEGKSFYSSTFVIDDDTPVALFSTLNGKLYKYPITPECSGPIVIDSSESIQMKPSLLSYALESNMLFASSKEQIIVMRPNDLSASLTLDVGGSSSYCYCCNFPEMSNILIFRSRKAILLLEFANENVFTTTIDDRCNGIVTDGKLLRVAICEGVLSTLVYGSPKVLSLAPTKQSSPLAYLLKKPTGDDGNEEDEENLPIEKVDVPPTFWSESDTDAKIVLSMGFNAPSLPAPFMTGVDITVSTTDKSCILVGLMLIIHGYGESIISVNGKRKISIICESEREFMIPLKKEELSLGKVVLRNLSPTRLIIVDIMPFTRKCIDLGINFDDYKKVDEKKKLFGKTIKSVEIPFESSPQAVIAEMAANALPYEIEVPADLLDQAFTAKNIAPAIQICAAKAKLDQKKWGEVQVKASAELGKSGSPVPDSLWKNVAITNTDKDNAIEVDPTMWAAKEKPMHSMFVAFTSKK